MLLLFSVRVAEWPPVWVRAVHSFYCAFNVYQLKCVHLPILVLKVGCGI